MICIQKYLIVIQDIADAFDSKLFINDNKNLKIQLSNNIYSAILPTNFKQFNVKTYICLETTEPSITVNQLILTYRTLQLYLCNNAVGSQREQSERSVYMY